MSPLVGLRFESDREKSPLMKELSELGLRHGIVMVVLVVKPSGEVAGHLVDHRDDTTILEAANAFEAAGQTLYDLADSARRYDEENR